MNVLALVIATSISSSCITNFMTIPSWMPTSVSASDTFGSSQHAGSSHRITSNTLAAVESVFEAYYERVYFQSAGGNDEFWRVEDWGPRGFNDMDFTRGASLKFDYISASTNSPRTVPNTHRLVEFPNILQFNEYAPVYPTPISQIVDTNSFILSRGTWNDGTRKVSFSSSIMNTAHTPNEYDWKKTFDQNYNFLACSPVWVCETGYMHDDTSLRNNPDNYPVPMMFMRAEENLYSYLKTSRLSQLIPPVSDQFEDLLNTKFAGSNPSGGITDNSRRLVPDDFSSLIATVSRALSVLDITHELPAVGEEMNVPYSRREGTVSKMFSGVTVIDIDEIYLTGDGEGVIKFEQPYTDEDFWETAIEHLDRNDFNDISATVLSSKRDRGRFEGTSTTLTQGFTPSSNPIIVGYVSDIIDNSYYSYIPDEFVGTNDIYISQIMFNQNMMQVLFQSREHDDFILSELYYDVNDVKESFELSVYGSVKVGRSCACSFTSNLRSLNTMDTIIHNLLPIEVPCSRAWKTGRVGNAYASYLSSVILNVNESTADSIESKLTYFGYQVPGIYSQDFYHKMGGYALTNYTDLLKRTYPEAREESYEKMKNLIQEKVGNSRGNWMDPQSFLSDVGSAYIDRSASGSYMRIEGATFAANFGTLESMDNKFVFVIENNGHYNEVAKVGHRKPAPSYGIDWFTDEEPLYVGFDLTLDDTGTGFELSDSAQDIKPVSADAFVEPMITTKWNWKALKMED